MFQVVRTVVVGIIPQFLQSLLMVPLGIVLFLFSFLALWMNEGFPLRHEWAEQARPIEEGQARPGRGTLASVTGPLQATRLIQGDPQFFQGPDAVAVYRVVEQYAWHQTVSETSERRWGGSLVREITYDYSLAWTPAPPAHTEFEEPQGHENMPLTVEPVSYLSGGMRVGSWGIDALQLPLPGASHLHTDAMTRIGRGADAQPHGHYLYLGDADPAAPEAGDERVSWWVIRPGLEVTVFGAVDGNALVPWTTEGLPFYDIVAGDRATAIDVLADEDTIRLWLLRIVGFAMLWGGLFLIFSPIYSLFDILPPVGFALRVVVAVVTFVPSLVLAGITVGLSIVGHNMLWTGIILGVAFTGMMALYYVYPRFRRPRRPVAETVVPTGTQPG